MMDYEGVRMIYDICHEKTADRKLENYDDIHVECKRYLVLEAVSNDRYDGISHLACYVEERWEEFYPDRPPVLHTIRLHQHNYFFDAHRPEPYHAFLLVQALSNTGGKPAKSIFHYAFHELIFKPEWEDYCNNPNHKPGLLEIWMPKYFEMRKNLELREREHQVDEVQSS